MRPRSPLWVATGLLTAAVLAGCKGDTHTPPHDGGGEPDRPIAEAGSDAQVCSSDGGVGNRLLGQPCACGGDCSSGYCVEGVCCNSPCNGTCTSCSLPLSLGTCTPTPAGVKPRVDSQCPIEDVATCGRDGTCDGAGKCRNWELGSVCKAGTCQGDAVVGTNICDGAGRCKLGASTVCGYYSCDSTTNKCFSKCSSDNDCIPGRKCVNSSCGPKPPGAVCKADGECASTHCAVPAGSPTGSDGVCCSTACNGACSACNLPNKLGTCSPIPAGQSHPLCSMQAATSCGTAGVCDGFGTCSMYPANSPCAASSCAGATAMNTARACDGLGLCQAPDVQDCGFFRCANGTCNTRCTTSADCKDGVACVAGSCGAGLLVDGQPCTMSSQCVNQHCVSDAVGGPGVCCNSACTGACRSCALGGALTGRCTQVAAGAADPRGTCVDAGPTTCGTDGKCDGAGACRRYQAGTVCAAETCVNDVFTGESTCNASGQCVKPTTIPCSPYHCNSTKCFTSCDGSNNQCQAPNVCGGTGALAQCGPKPNGQSCSNMPGECMSGFCAQGVCCNSACNTACRVCNLAGSVGTCSDVASGADPQGLCAMQAQSTCGTTGQCAAGQCARWPSGTQCLAASCSATAPLRTAPSTCNGTGTCVTPVAASCAPYTCSAGACNTSCTTANQATNCFAPSTCGASLTCGLQPMSGPCTATNQCAAGLTCYLAEGSPGVCCNSACSGTCETCKGTGGVCTVIAAGMVDPDPTTPCVAVSDPTTCGFDGRCSGNNTATNGTGNLRCEFFGSSQGCRSRSCTPGSATAPAMETAAATCNGAGMCPAAVTTSCGLYNKCDATNTFQCATTCASSADCVGVACNTVTSKCGDKRGQGETCNLTTDCNTGLTCVDGVCCNSACNGPCQACNLTTGGNTVGTCGSVAAGTAEALCPTTPNANPCLTDTGLCAAGGTCALVGPSVSCGTASCNCAPGPATCSMTAIGSCNGLGMCSMGAITSCGDFTCNGTTCFTMCTTDAQCANGTKCNTVTHACTAKGQGQACSAGTPGDCASGLFCVDGVCCNSACGGACQACNLSTGGNTVGTCGSVPASTVDPLCVAGPPCGFTGVCAAGGMCANSLAGTQCQAASCSSGNLTPARTCDGAGTCSPAGASGACTGGFACADAMSCLASCGADGDCANGMKCDTTAHTCTLRPLGATCNVNGDCATNQCIDGVCCNSACSGPCQACNLSTGGNTVGTCGSVAVGTADALCPTTPNANPCLTNTGLCTAGGTCALVGSSVTCGTETCADSPTPATHTPVGTCNGSGTCVQTPGTCPGGLKCADGTTCKMTCVDPVLDCTDPTILVCASASSCTM